MANEDDVLVTFKAPRELRDEFNQAVKKADQNASQVLRKAMRDFIDEANKENKK